MTDQMHSSRRHVLRLMLSSALAVICCDGQHLAAEPASRAGRPFSPERLRERARLLSTHEFQGPEGKLPEVLRDLTVEQYRDIHFRSDQALWADTGNFTAQFFHLGSYYTQPVRVFAVTNGIAKEQVYAPTLFDFGTTDLGPTPLPASLGFAGLRLHTTLNSSDYLDELIAFLGASYFRALGRGMRYGISARGLAIGTATSNNEEFPLFREFYLEKPVDNHSIVVHALLDSPSTSGTYTFTIRPGRDTIIDVNLTLFPRTSITTLGLAPMNSMFYFGPNDRATIDDFRAAVHDSEALAIWTGADEWLWRPVVNPSRLRISSFADHNPKGFGLIQRDREFSDYQDLDARYEKRPSLWVEPVGDWGPGAVMLIEIPTDRESNDNLVAFWRPTEPLAEHHEWQFTYRLHWCIEPPHASEAPPARVVATRIGRSSDPANTRFVIDFVGTSLPDSADGQVDAEVTTSRGEVRNVSTRFNDSIGGWRAAFDLVVAADELAELRCRLKVHDNPASEIWCYQWSV